VDFWGLWCRIAAEAECISYAVVMVVGDRGCGNLKGVGWCGGVAASDPAVGPAAALIGGGCQWYIAILPASHAPY
jgi:hypothetical protein